MSCDMNDHMSIMVKIQLKDKTWILTMNKQGCAKSIIYFLYYPQRMSL